MDSLHKVNESNEYMHFITQLFCYISLKILITYAKPKEHIFKKLYDWKLSVISLLHCTS